MGANHRTSVCNRERKDNAQPGGHAKKGRTEAAERSRETTAKGERQESRVGTFGTNSPTRERWIEEH